MTRRPRSGAHARTASGLLRILQSPPVAAAAALLTVAAVTTALAWPEPGTVIRASVSHPSVSPAPALQAGTPAVVAVGSTVQMSSSSASPAPGASAAASAPDAGITFPLHTSGASIVDAKGKAVRLNFVNWYGAESPDFVVGGLEYQPISSIINEIVSMGFNGIRLPWSNQMWETDPAIPASLVAANPQFA